MSNTDFPELVLDELVSHAKQRGTLDSVNTEEPKVKPGNGVECAIWVDGLGPARSGSGLSSTTVRIDYRVRLYAPLLQFPSQRVDVNLLRAAADLMLAYSGDFSLGGVARAIDLLGAFGDPLSMRAGYIEQDGAKYRVMTITVPVVVNDVWDQSE